MLLGLAAVVEDRPAADRVVDAHQRASGSVTGGDFLHGQGVGDIVDVGAAPFLGHHHAQQAQFTHLVDEAVVDPAGLFPSLGMGRDLATGEVAGHVADHHLFFAQFDIVHGSVPARVEAVEKTGDLLGP